MRLTRSTLAILTAGAFSAGAMAQTPPAAPAAPATVVATPTKGPTLADTLVKDLQCSGAPDVVLTNLRNRAKDSGAGIEDITDALNAIAKSGPVCAPVKTAASEIVDELAAGSTALIPGGSSSGPKQSVSAIVADAFVEADRRAAALKFESPPPPRNLTRGRISTP